ncbi:MAG: hypothetical protein ACRDD7_02435 [Peptostreptococcaceae bacterium]
MEKIIKNEYIKNEDFCILRIRSNKHGVFDVKIDNDSVERCMEHHWSINSFKNDSKGVFYYSVNKKAGLLHRFRVSKDDGDKVTKYI